MTLLWKSFLSFVLILSLFLGQSFVLVWADSAVVENSSSKTNSKISDFSTDNLEQEFSLIALKLDRLTKAILRKELELEKLNTLFRQQTTLVSPWRQRRLFAYGEGNACMTQSGLLLAICPQYQIAGEKTRFGAKQKPKAGASQRSNLAAANRMSLIANSYGTGGDLFELGINYKHYCALRKKGFVPSIYRNNVRKLRGEIDNLLEKRQQFLENSDELCSDDKTIALAEGKLLLDLRDLYLTEYFDYHNSCKKFWLVQNAAYVNDLVKNLTGGAGNIIALDANHLHRPAMFGGAGLLTLISGTIILMTPLVGRVTGNVSGLTARRVIAQESIDLHGCSVDMYAADYQSFLFKKGDITAKTQYILSADGRIPLYEDQHKMMLMKNSFLQKEKKEASQSLLENILFAGIVGPTKMTNGLTALIGGWHYPHNVPNAFKLYAAGTTTYIPGVAFSIFETARLWTVFERNQKAMRNSDLLPSNQFDRRLRMLDNMSSFL